ncbi:TetR/AcrR family transcriptional regulator [Kitasatospora sp. P5_F3]
MPKIVDPAARRTAVAEAVLRVVGRDGLEAASLRNVAEEAGLAIGSVRHYFGDHDELILFAMQELGRRLDARVRTHVAPLLAEGTDRRPRIEALLAEFLPLDAARHQEAALWLAFVTAARTRPQLQPHAHRMQESLRTLLAELLRRARSAGALPDDLDIELETLRLSALLDGLALQAVIEPHRVTPEVLRTVLSRHLRY